VIELVKQIADLQKKVDGLIKPEVPLGLSLITETVLSASATSVTFSSIPQGFRNLMLICHARSDAVAELDVMRLRFNGDTGNNYDLSALQGNSATASAGVIRATNNIRIASTEAANSRASSFSPLFALIPSYTLLAEKMAIGLSIAYGDVSADADMFTDYRAGRWRNTSAIVTVNLSPLNGTNFVSGSRFQIYGIY